jgi:hypothetical protein
VIPCPETVVAKLTGDPGRRRTSPKSWCRRSPAASPSRCCRIARCCRTAPAGWCIDMTELRGISPLAAGDYVVAANACCYWRGQPVRAEAMFLIEGDEPAVGFAIGELTAPFELCEQTRNRQVAAQAQVDDSGTVLAIRLYPAPASMMWRNGLASQFAPAAAKRWFDDFRLPAWRRCSARRSDQRASATRSISTSSGRSVRSTS